nr:hypothetical protein [Tanacetum cinerariifolium]
YDSWASRICLFIKRKKHGRMMLDSIDNGPLVYSIVEENWQSRPKKHSELTKARQLQDDYDLDYGLDVPMFQQGEDPTECINKAMAFLCGVASRFPPLNNQLRTSSNPRNQETIQDAGQPRVVKCYNCQGEGHMERQCTHPKRPRNAACFKEKLMFVEAQEASQILDKEQLTDDLDAYYSDCNDLSSARAVLMANLSSCDPEVLSEVPYFDSYPSDMINQDVQEMQYYKQTHVDDYQDNKIHSGSNIIPYS